MAILNGMTRRYFPPPFNPETLAAGEIPPDYELPYDDFLFWVNMAKATLRALVIVCLGVVILFVAPNVPSPKLSIVAWVIAIAAVVIGSCLVWFLPYRVFWDWRYRPYTMEASSSIFCLNETLPESKSWLLLPNSSNDTVRLDEGVETPQRKIWQWPAFFAYDTLPLPGTTSKRIYHPFSYVNSLFKDVQSNTKLFEWQRRPRVAFGVQNMAHIEALISYGQSRQAQIAKIQQEELEEQNRLSQRSLEELIAIRKVLEGQRQQGMNPDWRPSSRTVRLDLPSSPTTPRELGQ